MVYWLFSLTLVGMNVYPVVLPDGTRPGMYNTQPVTQLIVKLSDHQRYAIASMGEQATQVVRNATGLQTRILLEHIEEGIPSGYDLFEVVDRYLGSYRAKVSRKRLKI